MPKTRKQLSYLTHFLEAVSVIGKHCSLVGNFSDIVGDSNHIMLQ